ncbi:glycosyltransferase family 2 protein [Shimia sp.]|uniref:glycosyltransferase family 2 protein n=1 Tax=Shimia sp. TaxID=1954381 RepID=UPI003298CC5C
MQASPSDLMAKATMSRPDLAVIVPTFNERENVATLAQKVDDALQDIPYELIFVDDSSPDGTSDAVRALSQKDGRIRCIERIGRRGLSTAVIEGILSTSAPFAAVIDGDMQHDETQLTGMLSILKSDRADVVVGSRYAQGGGLGNWDQDRARMSGIATKLSKQITKVDLSDPMSGFFMLNTSQFRTRAADLSGVGFKILLDYLATPGEKLRVAEVPFEFRTRAFGKSKLDNKVLLEFLELLIAKSVGKFVPTKFVMFSIVGALGVVVHMLALTVLFKWNGVVFVNAQIGATFLAMTANFFVNNFFTYYDRRLRGWSMLRGWASFCLVSLVGALANIGVAVYLFESASTIWFASALAGILVGAAWNYAASALLTWNK